MRTTPRLVPQKSSRNISRNAQSLRVKYRAKLVRLTVAVYQLVAGRRPHRTPRWTQKTESARLRRMQIECHAEKIFRSDAQAAFDLIVDSQRFPGTFVGYGLIPSIRAIVLETPLAIGSIRRIHNSDGSVLTEHITVLDAPTRHAYVLSGFRAPFAWLVNKGEADWLVSAADSGCNVRWSYTFTLTSGWIYPLATLLLRVFMQRAMQRCLDNMANLLASSTSNPAETA